MRHMGQNLANADLVQMVRFPSPPLLLVLMSDRLDPMVSTRTRCWIGSRADL